MQKNEFIYKLLLDLDNTRSGQVAEQTATLSTAYQIK